MAVTIVMAYTQKILIVDDKPADLFSLQQILHETGAEVVRVQNGNDALKASLNHEFALALLDVQMPKMSGDCLARRILAIRDDMPIIIASGYRKRIDDPNAAELGAKALLDKPFTNSTLSRTVNNVLKNY